jgi:hypothetical protein
MGRCECAQTSHVGGAASNDRQPGLKHIETQLCQVSPYFTAGLKLIFDTTPTAPRCLRGLPRLLEVDSRRVHGLGLGRNGRPVRPLHPSEAPAEVALTRRCRSLGECCARRAGTTGISLKSGAYFLYSVLNCALRNLRCAAR